MRSLVLTAFLLALASSCGFHLRGTEGTPTPMPPLHLVPEAVSGSLLADFRSSLEDLGVPVARSREEAAYMLVLVAADLTRRAATTSNQITVAEYELGLELEFRVEARQGQEIIAPSTITQERVYTFDRRSLIGSREEEELLKEEMVQEMAANVVRRIAARLPTR